MKKLVRCDHRTLRPLAELEVIANGILNHVGRILKLNREMPAVLPENGDLTAGAKRAQAHRILYEWRQLLHDQNRLDATQKIFQHPPGNRIGADLLQGHRLLQTQVGDDLRCIGIGNATGNDTIWAVAPATEKPG